MKDYNNDNVILVSIIIPVYNSENYIDITVQSIKNQTYKNWEAIFIDDCSKDNSSLIIKNYSIVDKRIKYFKLPENLGAAAARNFGLEKATGQFIAFLDDDDLWFPQKLESQINYMLVNNYHFTCTYYDKIDAQGNKLNVIVKNKPILNYSLLLKHNPGNSTVMYNSYILGKTFIPNIRKRNDYLMWLKVIKKSSYLYTLPVILSSHRVRSNSLSSNKLNLLKYHWEVYRKHENLSLIKSIYLIMFYSAKTIINKMKNIRTKRSIKK
jgi:glycosyltransferase involved in cell wall biosynthesis